jgi:hypothetical protein
VDPASKDVASASKDVASASKDVDPASKDVASASKDVASASKDGDPASKDGDPASKDVASVSKDVDPASLDNDPLSLDNDLKSTDNRAFWDKTALFLIQNSFHGPPNQASGEGFFVSLAPLRARELVLFQFFLVFSDNFWTKGFECDIYECNSSWMGGL